MRSGVRVRRHDDEEESAFVSMTDMTVSFLFIVMILLAFFASQFQRDDVVPRAEYNEVVTDRDRLEELVQQKDEEIERLENLIVELRKKIEELSPDDPLQNYLTDVAQERYRILVKLQAQLQADIPSLEVIISPEMDALRFKGDGLFKSGEFGLEEEKRQIVQAIGARLDALLPCYTLGNRSNWAEDCNGVGAVVEAVQIEGHTDTDGRERENLTLSTNRANETYFAMKETSPTIVEHLNSRMQPVISVAGYGWMRPVADNLTKEGKAANRRIDLRIIMYTPSSPEEITEIKTELQRGMVGEPR